MSDKRTILLERYSRTIALEEDLGGFVLHLDEKPAPLESVYLSRDEVRAIALAMLAAIGESNDPHR